MVQEDVCNGCGYCVVGLPVRRDRPARASDGRAWKCTLCYDRLKDGLKPACAKACPTESIQFGAARRAARARRRRGSRAARGAASTEARLYGADPDDGVGGDGAFFLLLDEPEVYGLPPDPVVTTRDLAGDVAAAGAGRRRAGAPASRPRSREAGDERGERAAHGRARAEPALLLRPPGDQAAGVEARRCPWYFFTGGLTGARGDARARWRRSGRPRAARAARVGRRDAGGHRQPAAPDHRPRAPGALPEHAARVQGHLADERRLVGAGRDRAPRTGWPPPTRCSA